MSLYQSVIAINVVSHYLVDFMSKAGMHMNLTLVKDWASNSVFIVTR